MAKKKSNDNKTLNAYRNQMRDVTKSVLDLASARQNIAQLIARIKQTSGADIENQSVEENLIAEMVEYAKSISLDEGLARRLVSELIEHSKIAQRRRIYLNSIKNHLRSNGIKTVSIIGAGRMGGWFASYFKELGLNVVFFDSNRKLSREKAARLGCTYTTSFDEVAQSDMAVVAVPIKIVAAEIRKLGEHRKARPKLALLEISSVKNEMERAVIRKKLPANVALFSIHPLFGASANPFALNSLVQVGKPSGLVKGIFPHYKIFFMNSKDHDQLMSTILTMPHAHALTFADSVARMRKRIPRGIGSSSYNHLLDLAKRSLKESGDVYYEIEASNPYAEGALIEMIDSVRRLRNVLKDKSAFQKFFRETGKALE
ncbi:MAG: prephenate dehydrogenase/arogenate dehydrogenase family protein [Nitrososphaerota archaeon]|nr:prephenate dehydrogenase/arogenate dehydrogenase family protein [Nitrososphaerota archaeon]MDG6922264.1 prephenate dehydrogenase/arogenate dehydrogenase family protein [Nitrososphaerota archaeon]